MFEVFLFSRCRVNFIREDLALLELGLRRWVLGLTEVAVFGAEVQKISGLALAGNRSGLSGIKLNDDFLVFKKLEQSHEYNPFVIYVCGNVIPDNDYFFERIVNLS